MPGTGTFAESRSRVHGLIIDRAISSTPNVVLSSENFIGSHWKDLYANAAAHAVSIRNFCLPRGAFQVVLYLRPQLSWLESSYIQTIKSGHFWDAESYALAKLSNSRLYFSILVQELIDAVGHEHLVVRPYTKSGDVVTDFLAVIGMSGTRVKLTELSRENLALNAGDVELLRLVNRSTPWLRHEAVRQLKKREMNVAFGSMSCFPVSIQERLREISLDDWTATASLLSKTQKFSANEFMKALDDPSAKDVRPFIGDYLAADYMHSRLAQLDLGTTQRGARKSVDGRPASFFERAKGFKKLLRGKSSYEVLIRALESGKHTYHR